MITHDRLQFLLHYDPKSGVFTWLVRTKQSRINVGDIAGWRTADGYSHIEIAGRAYLAHRLAWFYVTGAWPKYEIDHIDGNRSNNRIANLRDVSRSVNKQNLKRSRSDNKAGFLGVSPCRQKFRATINLDGRRTHIGYFDTPELAHAAYLDAKRALHPGNTL